VERVGSSSPAHFSNCFREQFEQLPSEYSSRSFQSRSGW
jgi:transcriptional regulator GlxA family with amidase domain